MFSLFKRQDWVLNGALGFLLLASLVVLYSISSAELFFQQIAWVLLSIILIFIFVYIDWRGLVSYRWIILAIYFGAIGLLVLTCFIAPPIRGVRSWLAFGPLRFQPSELMKVAMIILFSYYFAKRHIGIGRLSNIIRPFIYFLVPALLIFIQPDLGTVTVLFGIWLGFLLVSGLRMKHLVIGFLILIIVAAVGWSFVLQPYQKDRIVGLFQPNLDPLGVNYSTIQSKIAIGSGGFFGKGFGQGTQIQLGFLPEPGTDYIYSSLIEEWGLFGGILVLLAFGLLILRIIMIGLEADNNFYRLFCLGAVIMFLIQFTINAGSAVGVLPVIGITFPFLSYGGSSILINAIIIGIVQSAHAHRGT